MIDSAALRQTLRRSLAAKPMLVAPGVYDAMSALFAVEAGFRALFVSGSALAYTQLARPDVNLVTVNELADAVARIRDRVDVPLLVDGDSGHGNAANVQRTVRMLERAGAAAIQIEDQVNHKPPAALSSRPLVAIGEMVGKIKAALDARTDAGLVISARTDAAITIGVDEALRRADAFITAGADMVFVEGLSTREDIQTLMTRTAGRVPLLYNMLGSAGPLDTVAAAESAGYAITLFPGVAVQAAASALRQALGRLHADGAVAPPAGDALDAKALNAALGTPAFLEAAKRYDGAR